jgi:hypothetical protein
MELPAEKCHPMLDDKGGRQGSIIFQFTTKDDQEDHENDHQTQKRYSLNQPR